MKLYETLRRQLVQNPDFVTEEGELKKWVVLASAREAAEPLLALLLEHSRLRERFFQEVKGALVFRQEVFSRFIEQKNYLDNSYTRYRNRVGLNVNGQYLKQHNQVALAWPFKDCVLEGGQSREEDRRQEVFFNEVLAQDEITQLLEPKVLTGALRIDRQGARPLEHFSRDAEGDITDNLIIKGNNLLALASLRRHFAGKVKLIYADPPYNTGNDGFNYNDSFNRSTWLTFMKNRLELARTLLHRQGAIFVQCDDNEQAYLKVLMDEVFGKENFRETIVVKTSTPSGVNAVNVRRGERLFKVKEYLLFYSREPGYRFRPLYVKSNFNPNYRYQVVKSGDGYQVTDLKKQFGSASELQGYALANYRHIYSLEKNNKKAGEKIKQIIKQSRSSQQVIEFENSKGQTVLVYQGGVFIPLADRVVRDTPRNHFGTLVSDLWDDEIFQTNQTEGGVSLPGGKKPEKLLQRILELATRPHDLVLDFHLGSGTTAAVAHKMNRRYMGIEQLDYGENDSVARLKKVIAGERTGISAKVNWQGGGEFVYLELKKHNQRFMEEIAAARSSQALWRIWQQMKARSFLKYHINTFMHDGQASEFAALSLQQQRQHLASLLDKNQLYVNLSSLHDTDFACTELEKAVTLDFYQEKL